MLLFEHIIQNILIHFLSKMEKWNNQFVTVSRGRNLEMQSWTRGAQEINFFITKQNVDEAANLYLQFKN